MDINKIKMTELSKSQIEELEIRIKDDINNYCQELYKSEHRDHLGASIMGEACSRKLWYGFRWIKKEIHDGRILRLFQVGHDSEPRFIKYLKGIGFEVWEKDESGKQFKISACNGHYGGSLDGICKAPERYNLPIDLVLLNEFKTNGTGAGFTNVQDNFLKTKPKHYAQMSQYGKHYKFEYGLYLIENKNDSDIIVKIIKLDWRLGEELEKKAGDIISAKFPPEKISLSSAHFECKFCTFTDICHENAAIEKNCRSCINASPVENSEWYCGKFNNNIPKEFIKNGCDQWEGII